jgi:ribosomal protein L30/L7E
MTTADFQTAVWQRFKAKAEARLQSMRARNDNQAMTAEETAKLRGQIAELKHWLAADLPPPAVEADRA